MFLSLPLWHFAHKLRVLKHALVMFDEAFNKMDSDRIVESVRLLRKMGLQAIICTPPDKLSDIMPLADKTLLVNKEKYRMWVLDWGKEVPQA